MFFFQKSLVPCPSFPFTGELRAGAPVVGVDKQLSSGAEKFRVNVDAG